MTLHRGRGFATRITARAVRSTVETVPVCRLPSTAVHFATTGRRFSRAATPSGSYAAGLGSSAGRSTVAVTG